MNTKPKGTKDIYGKEANIRQYLVSVWHDLMDKYNYHYIQTPVFEHSDVYHRAVGENSDIVSKETYDFKDRADRSLTLRPEGTAGIVRSYVEEKMYANNINPTKLHYVSTMYRYERPQLGRYREFTQLGLEVFGSKDPAIDAEVVTLVVTYFKLLGLSNIKVKINSLGDQQSFQNYRTALVNYFEPLKDKLSTLSQERLQSNPLRILDSKEEVDQEIIKNAPISINYLTEESKADYQKIKEYLDVLEVDYVEDNYLVRGLDYYTDLVFEVEGIINDKAIALGGGGRYDLLVEQMGGPSTKAVGYALGLDRVVLALQEADIKLPLQEGLDIYVMYVNDEEKQAAVYLNNMLRVNGFSSDMDYNNRSLKAQFKQADFNQAKFYLLINSDDLKENLVTLKNTETKHEEKIELEYIIYFLDENIINDHHDHDHNHEHDLEEYLHEDN